MKTTVINSKWRVDHDGESSTLVFFEPRIRNKGLENEVEFIYEQPYYYSNLASALEGYFLKSLDDSKDLTDVLRVIAEVRKEIYAKNI